MIHVALAHVEIEMVGNIMDGLATNSQRRLQLGAQSFARQLKRQVVNVKLHAKPIRTAILRGSPACIVFQKGSRSGGVKGCSYRACLKRHFVGNS